MLIRSVLTKQLQHCRYCPTRKQIADVLLTATPPTMSSMFLPHVTIAEDRQFQFCRSKQARR
jgi:hypothetical protein